MQYVLMGYFSNIQGNDGALKQTKNKMHTNRKKGLKFSLSVTTASTQTVCLTCQETMAVLKETFFEQPC